MSFTSSPAQKRPPHNAKQWACTSCTFYNEGGTCCAICGAARAPASSSADADNKFAAATVTGTTTLTTICPIRAPNKSSSLKLLQRSSILNMEYSDSDDGDDDNDDATAEHAEISLGAAEGSQLVIPTSPAPPTAATLSLLRNVNSGVDNGDDDDDAPISAVRRLRTSKVNETSTALAEQAVGQSTNHTLPVVADPSCAASCNDDTAGSEVIEIGDDDGDAPSSYLDRGAQEGSEDDSENDIEFIDIIMEGGEQGSDSENSEGEDGDDDDGDSSVDFEATDWDNGCEPEDDDLIVVTKRAKSSSASSSSSGAAATASVDVFDGDDLLCVEIEDDDDYVRRGSSSSSSYGAQAGPRSSTSPMSGGVLIEPVDGFPDPLLPYFRPTPLLHMLNFAGTETVHVAYTAQFKGACAPVKRNTSSSSSSSGGAGGSKGGGVPSREIAKQLAQREAVRQEVRKQRNRRTGGKRKRGGKAAASKSKSSSSAKGSSSAAAAAAASSSARAPSSSSSSFSAGSSSSVPRAPIGGHSRMATSATSARNGSSTAPCIAVMPHPQARTLPPFLAPKMSAATSSLQPLASSSSKSSLSTSLPSFSKPAGQPSSSSSSSSSAVSSNERAAAERQSLESWNALRNSDVRGQIRGPSAEAKPAGHPSSSASSSSSTLPSSWLAAGSARPPSSVIEGNSVAVSKRLSSSIALPQQSGRSSFPTSTSASAGVHTPAAPVHAAASSPGSSLASASSSSTGRSAAVHALLRAGAGSSRLSNLPRPSSSSSSSSKGSGAARARADDTDEIEDIDF